MNVLLTGATGFVGKELVSLLLNKGCEIRVLSRSAARAGSSLPTPVKCFDWDAENEVAPATALKNIDVVIHLAGENVGAGRWSPEVKRRILKSRELGTRNLVAGINQMDRPPALISASAVGYYGNRGDEVLTEETPRGDGFLAGVCETWELESHAAKVSRLVTPRIGVVLGREGGALAKLLPIFKAGLGGRSGDGTQWMAWVHLHDLVSFLARAATDPAISGVYNLVAPEASTNERFAQTLGRVLHRPAIFPAPAFALKLAFGEMAEQTILASQRATSVRLESSGFRFEHPTLEGALRQITAT